MKLFLEHSTGFLHASAVSGNDEIRVAGRDGDPTRRFRLVLNAVIYGLHQEAIQAATEEALATVEARHGLTRELRTTDCH